MHSPTDYNSHIVHVWLELLQLLRYPQREHLHWNISLQPDAPLKHPPQFSASWRASKMSPRDSGLSAIAAD